MNAMSLKANNHFNTIFEHAHANNADIISIAETWLTSYHNTNTVNIHNYYLVRNDRKLKYLTGKREFIQGGGVACYIRYGIRHKIIHKSTVRHK